MPFLGNTPANTFVSIAKQTITGNGGTAYTLSYPVTNANEIDVFYNNVRQEPTIAYTASGTTITFTEAIASTDSVYIIFNGQAVGTINPSAGSVGLSTLDTGTVDTRYVKKTGDSISGTFTVKDSTEVDTYLNVSSTGRVTMPYQPAFRVYHSSNLTWNSGALSPVVYNTSVFNIGNHYNTSTGVFTAPIAGRYVFTVYEMYMGEPTYTFVFAAVQINGVTTTEFMRQGTKSDYDTFGGTLILSLSANDQIRIVVGLAGVDAGYLREGSNMNSFMGYLLG